MDTSAILSSALTDMTMKLAVEDKTAQYLKEQKKAEAKQEKQQQVGPNERVESDDDDDLMDEDEREIMERMKQERLKGIKEKQEELEYQQKKADKEKNLWYGEYQEIVESEFLPYVTKAKYSVCHFAHKDFERCKIIDHHLRKIAPEHTECKFLRLDAEKAPFFVNKLAIKVLPTLCCFKDGILVDQIIGFEDLGARDDFKTLALTRR